MNRRSPWIAILAALLCGGAAAAPPGPAATPAEPASWKQRVQRDWLIQLELRQKGARPSVTVAPAADAAGAVDGVKNGKWGFHTGGGRSWWHVDLGRSRPLDRVVVWNRCGAEAARARQLMVLLSDDARKWRQVYGHEGKAFYGFTDKKPLAVPLKGVKARFVRVAIPGGYLHLDEVEVFATTEPTRNVALGRPADQSSASRWSTGRIDPNPDKGLTYPVGEVVDRGRRLAADLRAAGVKVAPALRQLDAVARRAAELPENAPREARRALYFRARWTVRRLALANPLLDFEEILFVKLAPGRYLHMSDQYYGWFSRPGGGVCILAGWKEGAPRARCLTAGLPAGSFLRPDLSFDGRKVLFAYCRHYPRLPGNKMDKAKLPEDAFYSLYEMNADGTGLRRLTRGRYDDFDARYLPDGRIVFLSTRKGQFIQCGKASAQATTAATLPDSYVRCGGGTGRPVAVYTLHVMGRDGKGLRAISGFENFEWTPMVAADGRITYARWDYIDRPNGPFMSLWSTNPDGTNPQLVYGNYTTRPHCIFEARSIPGSNRMVFTASGHHFPTAGSLVLLDPNVGTEGLAPLTRLTPEVPFPEAEGRPASYYANPWPLSERHFLTAWSSVPLVGEGGRAGVNALGLYLYDAFGNLEPIYRDPAIGSQCPIPLRPRPRPPVRASGVRDDAPPEGRFLLLDVCRGLEGVSPGSVKRLRIVGVTPKTRPEMNRPNLGVTREDPGKFVLGTVPVERDGSAHFRAPAGVAVFFQALDGEGLAVQTMRTLTYVQPGQTLSCVGCHEPRNTAPPAGPVPLAARRRPSRIAPGPEGSWPLRFDRLVQPVLEQNCVRCHRPEAKPPAAAKLDLTAGQAWQGLLSAGKADLRRLSGERNLSRAGDCVARRSALLAMLAGEKPHQGVRLDRDALRRLTTWMDLYCQRRGCFSDAQEQRLRDLRKKWAPMLTGK